MSRDVLLYADRQTVGIGDVYRYRITLDVSQLGEEIEELHLRIKNVENPLLRPVYISGPYSIYIDVRPFRYDEDGAWGETMQYCCDLRPDEHFHARLLVNRNSWIEGSTKHSWTVDVLSQICVSAAPKVKYKLRIGTSRKATKKGEKQEEEGVFDSCVEVERWDTGQLWNLPPVAPRKPVHLVVLTHGIFSSVGCDMLYMKDRIERAAAKMDGLCEDGSCNVVVRGCMDNMGKSAHGIRHLGVKVGKYVLEVHRELSEKYDVNQISFIGHSLGGPTQTMAIHYIALEKPDFFEKVRPINFVALASPFLGVTNDMPLFVSLGLSIGAFGLTGRDLTLKRTPLTSKEGLATVDPSGGRVKSARGPVMQVLPLEPAQRVLQRFKRRTLYANVLHDGIVPLRTAALLYLDWRSLSKVRQMRQQKLKAGLSNGRSSPSTSTPTPTPTPTPTSTSTSDSTGSNTRMGVIPEAPLDKRATAQFFMPHKFVKYKKYARAQVSEPDVDPKSNSNQNSPDIFSESEDKDPTPPKNINNEEAKFNPPPEASTVLAALSVVTSSLPTQEYIQDPSRRTDTIVHDRLYHPNELPPPHYESRPFYKKIIYPNESSNKLQEQIARSWQEKMTWRKVLVDLKPDSHNNIVVRRRFVNLFGNVAVRHMAEIHFGGS